jgi:hypothetical protein
MSKRVSRSTYCYLQAESHLRDAEQILDTAVHIYGVNDPDLELALIKVRTALSFMIQGRKSQVRRKENV